MANRGAFRSSPASKDSARTVEIVIGNKIRDRPCLAARHHDHLARIAAGLTDRKAGAHAVTRSVSGPSREVATSAALD